jgi:hypothetical protein
VKGSSEDDRSPVATVAIGDPVDGWSAWSHELVEELRQVLPHRSLPQRVPAEFGQEVNLVGGVMRPGKCGEEFMPLTPSNAHDLEEPPFVEIEYHADP